MPFKHKNKWIGQVRYNYRRIRKTFPTKKEAIVWEQETQKELKFQPKETPLICLIDWATSYLEFAKDKFASKTWKEKKAVFKRFLKVIGGDVPANDLNPGMVLSYLQKEYKTRPGYTVNCDRKNLIAAWNWGIKYMGIPSPNPCFVDRFPEVRINRYVPSEKDFWKVYDMSESKQDEIMLLTYLHLAARRSEIFKLQWQDIDFSESRVRLFTRKRKDGTLESDWLPLTDDLYNALLEHKQNSLSPWVFPNLKTEIPYDQRNKWLPRLCDKAKVKKFGLHAIRHLTASILARNDVAMVDIQAILRHKKLATTERYIKRLNSLRPALKLLPFKTKSPSQEPFKAKKGLAINS